MRYRRCHGSAMPVAVHAGCVIYFNDATAALWKSNKLKFDVASICRPFFIDKWRLPPMLLLTDSPTIAAIAANVKAYKIWKRKQGP
jgi:hypothetical protein